MYMNVGFSFGKASDYYFHGRWAASSITTGSTSRTPAVTLPRCYNDAGYNSIISDAHNEIWRNEKGAILSTSHYRWNSLSLCYSRLGLFKTLMLLLMVHFHLSVYDDTLLLNLFSQRQPTIMENDVGWKSNNSYNRILGGCFQ